MRVGRVSAGLMLKWPCSPGNSRSKLVRRRRPGIVHSLGLQSAHGRGSSLLQDAGAVQYYQPGALTSPQTGGIALLSLFSGERAQPPVTK